jgi:uncharacterized membrane protein
MKYKCPHCNFPIFNRRVKNCESCHALLPAEFLYSKEQIEAIDAEFEKNKAQVARLRRNIGVTGSSGDSGSGDGGFGNCGGDGGGDCG